MRTQLGPARLAGVKDGGWALLVDYVSKVEDLVDTGPYKAALLYHSETRKLTTTHLETFKTVKQHACYLMMVDVWKDSRNYTYHDIQTSRMRVKDSETGEYEYETVIDEYETVSEGRRTVSLVLGIYDLESRQPAWIVETSSKGVLRARRTSDYRYPDPPERSPPGSASIIDDLIAAGLEKIPFD